MRRSYLSNSYSKGQWFLISTVMVSAAFLAISFLFEEYFAVDNSAMARIVDNYYFDDIKYGLNKTVQLVGFSDCSKLETGLDEFIHFSEQRMAKMGYYLFVSKSIDCNSPNPHVDFGILLASDRMVVYENVDPNDIISGIYATTTTMPPTRINVDVTPTGLRGTAQIFINGTSYGLAPVSVDVNPGSYNVSFGDVNNYIKPVDQIFTIAQYETKNVVGQYIPVIYAPVISIISPFNIIYDRAIALGLQFFVSLNVPGDWCGFEVDGAANVTMSGAGGLTEHQYRKQINISNIAGNLTDYQVNLTVNTSQLISAGKMLASCNNTRFTWLNSSSGQEQNISYWNETACNTSSTIYWIKVPFLPNNTNTNVYMYYGNSAANSTTLFNSTFTKQFNVTAGGSSDNSLVGEWHMDEGGGTGVNDSSGNSRHCTIQGSVPWQSSDGGQWDNRNDVNGSYVGFFRGSNLYFNNNLNNYVSGGWINTVPNTFTMEIWVNTQKSVTICSQSTSGVCGVSGQSYAIFPGNGASSDAGAGISVGTNAIQVFEHGSSYMPALLSYNVILSGWNHIVVVYTNKQPKLYLNGNLVKTGLTSVRSNVYSSYTFSDGATNYGPFSGYLDEAKIYNKALGADEIKAHYERRKYAFPSPSPTIGSEEQITPNNYINFSYFNSSMDGGQRYVRFWCNDTAGTMNYSGTYFTTPNYYHDTFDDELGIAEKNNVNISNGDVKMNETGGSWSWYYPGWSYRKQINISNTAGNLTDYQVAIDPKLFNTTGLVGSWHFSESSGNIAKDSSGLGNDGTCTNMPNNNCNWTAGYNDTGTGLKFDGMNDYVVCGYTNLPTGANSRTVEFWTKRATSANFVVGPYPFFYGTKTQYNGFGLYGNAGTTDIYFYGHSYDYDTGINLDDTNWHHITVTFNGTHVRTYKDGIESSGSPTARPLLNTVLSSFNFTIAGFYVVDQYWNGTIDEVKIYNRSLSQAEIQASYQAKARLDYADMRFTWLNSSSGNEQNISYWFEQDNRTWIKVPFLKNNTNTNIYMYYGNSSAKSTSNGTATFAFFDDFEDGIIDSNRWNIIGSGVSESNGNLILTPGLNAWDGVVSKTNFINSSVFYTKWIQKQNSEIQQWITDYLPVSNPWFNKEWYRHEYSSTNYNIQRYIDPDGSQPTLLTSSLTTYPVAAEIRILNKNVSFFINGQQKYSEISSGSLPNIYLVLGSWSGASQDKFDFVILRKYFSPEPSSLIGLEEGSLPNKISNITSVAITPISFSTWDKFCADDTLAQGTNITYALLNAINNQAIPGFENMPSGCTNISSLVFSSVRLFAKLTTNNTNTPILHSWNISWSNITGTGTLLHVIFDSFTDETKIALKINTTVNTTAGQVNLNVTSYQGIEPVARTDVSPIADNVYHDVDVSSYIPSGAEGVVLEVVNLDISNAYYAGVRKNGGTSDILLRGEANSHQIVFIGVDNNRIFEARRDINNVHIYLIGYIPDGAGSFLTNAIAKSLGTTGSWGDISIASDTGSDTAKVALLIITHATSESSKYFTLRENGSSDDFYLMHKTGWTIGRGAAIGLDSNEVFQGRIEDTDTDFYLVGWINKGYAYTWANAKDYSTGTINSWVDNTFTDIPASAKSNGVFFDFHFPDSSSDPWYYNTGIRENGASYNNAYSCQRNFYGWMQIDSNRIAEQWIVSTDVDLKLWGYVKAAILPIGVLTSTNLLSGQIVISINSFGYNATSVPSGTSLRVQFSQDNSNWYNSTGSSGGWNTLSQGSRTIDLSSLGWSGPNFYYRAQYTSDADNTPVLDNINVTYSG